MRANFVQTLYIFLILFRKHSITFHCNWVWQNADMVLWVRKLRNKLNSPVSYIPGRSGANYVEPTVRVSSSDDYSEGRLMRVRIQTMTNVEKYPELANVRFFHSLKTSQRSIMLRECPNESGVCDGFRLQPVVWTAYYTCKCYMLLQGTPEYMFNWILFPQYLHSPQSKNLRKVVLTQERRQKQRKEQTFKRSQSERGILCFWRSQYSLLSARVHWCWGPNQYNGFWLLDASLTVCYSIRR